MDQGWLLEKYRHRLGQRFSSGNDKALRRNLLKLVLFYEELNVETITEVPAYPVYIVIVLLVILYRKLHLVII